MEQGFSYFADHQPPLSDMVQRGRLEFLAQFPSLTSPEISDRLPVPNDEEAFRACRLDWRATPAGDQARALYTDLIALRHTDPVLSALGTMDVAVESAAPTPEIVLLRYSGRDQSRLLLINLGPLTQCSMNHPLFAPDAGHRWERFFCSEQSRYGGHGCHEFSDEGGWRLQAGCAWLFRSVPRTDPPS